MTETAPKSVPCPNCGRPVRWEAGARWRPFCSERCRMADLGDWLTEQHAIAGSPSDATDDDVPKAD